MDKEARLVVAIDGPAGSGKSTVCKIVAKKLNYLYLDSGATYRALTCKALSERLDLTDERALIELAKKTKITLTKDNSVFVDGAEVTTEIRSPEVTRNVFYIARVPGVRECMVRLQRKIAEGDGVIVEGRDITTVVFPNADRKIYLDADVRERAKRRFKELKERGYDTVLEEVEKELISRDKEDKGRKVAPLRIADGAVVVDTTNMSIEQVVDRILTLIK